MHVLKAALMNMMRVVDLVLILPQICGPLMAFSFLLGSERINMIINLYFTAKFVFFYSKGERGNFTATFVQQPISPNQILQLILNGNFLLVDTIIWAFLSHHHSATRGSPQFMDLFKCSIKNVLDN